MARDNLTRNKSKQTFQNDVTCDQDLTVTGTLQAGVIAQSDGAIADNIPALEEDNTVSETFDDAEVKAIVDEQAATINLILAILAGNGQMAAEE